MNAQVEAQLQGIGTLCKILGATGGAALHSERIVFRIGQVAAPERDHHRTEVVVGMSTQVLPCPLTLAPNVKLPMW